MSTVFLREMVAKGFCGHRIATDQRRGMGYISTVLDKIIARGLTDKMKTEEGRLEFALQYAIPYEERLIFDRCAEGLANSCLCATGSAAEQVDITWDEDTIRFVRAHNAGVVTEPVYDYCATNDYVPLHSLAAEALLRNRNGGAPVPLKVWSIWVNGGQRVEQEYPVLMDNLLELVRGAMDRGNRRIGPQCLTCPDTSCNYYDGDFDASLKKWLDARQRLAEAEEVIRRHLTYEGPTKSGMHLWYMDEGERRFFADKRWEEFLAKIVAVDPVGYARYLRPDSTEIFKAIKEGKLPEEIASFFKKTKYWTIESKVSM